FYTDMLKEFLLAAIIAIPAMSFAQKFGVIDTQSLVQAMPEMKDVETQIEASSKKYEAEFKSLQDEFQAKFEEFQKMEESTPQTIKDRRMQELQELDQKIQQFRQTASQDLQQQSEKLMAPIRQKVLTAIQTVGAEGSYTFIFENTMPIFSGQDVVNVTAEVKAKLGIK
ncbi:MAG: OmpH family outer membrane protein, partial [Paramuribaculum sp.]|nr:OmpH family outer membrane protein [Paramuribaculum sp.]